MEHISNILGATQSHIPQIMKSKPSPVVTAKPNSKSSGECTEQINEMFLKFSIFYGHIWRSQFKNEHYFNLARQQWQEAIIEFEKTTIDEAIEVSIKQRDMPPTLAQFVDCCKQIIRKLAGFYRPEPVVKANPDVAVENLRKIKSILNMPSKHSPATSSRAEPRDLHGLAQRHIAGDPSALLGMTGE